jgi:hypothetical protein
VGLFVERLVVGILCIRQGLKGEKGNTTK